MAEEGGPASWIAGVVSTAQESRSIPSRCGDSEGEGTTSLPFLDSTLCFVLCAFCNNHGPCFDFSVASAGAAADAAARAAGVPQV